MFNALPSMTGDSGSPAAPPDQLTASQGAGLQRLQVHGRDDSGRAAVEAFIRKVYAQRYGATVPHLAPFLVSLSDESGSPVAAAGYRVATEALYLERYFDAPIEGVLAALQGFTPARERIVEVGHLAAGHAGAGRRLIFALGHHLAELQMQWVVGTLTQALRHLFVRMGVTPCVLGVADPSRLGPEARDWGTYYDHHPVVLAGDLGRALQVLRHPPVTTTEV